MRRALFWLGLLLCLGVPNWMLLRKEQSLRGGRFVYLELAPVDPRSLMQGDYMALSYRLQEQPPPPGCPARGFLELELDPRGVVRAWHPAPPEKAGPRVRYRLVEGRFQVATDAYHFSEGQGIRYSKARYGRFHLADDGGLTLRALTDEKLTVL